MKASVLVAEGPIMSVRPMVRMLAGAEYGITVFDNLSAGIGMRSRRAHLIPLVFLKA